MAGTVVITTTTRGTVTKIKFAWTSDGSGDADDTTVGSFNGKIIALVTDPDGTDAPTDNYDVTVTDDEGIDVLVGAGADRDTANTEQVTDSALLGVVGSGKLTLTVSNAGAAKVGEVFVYIR